MLHIARVEISLAPRPSCMSAMIRSRSSPIACSRVSACSLACSRSNSACRSATRSSRCTLSASVSLSERTKRRVSIQPITTNSGTMCVSPNCNPLWCGINAPMVGTGDRVQRAEREQQRFAAAPLQQCEQQHDQARSGDRQVQPPDRDAACQREPVLTGEEAVAGKCQPQQERVEPDGAFDTRRAPARETQAEDEEKDGAGEPEHGTRRVGTQHPPPTADRHGGD